MNNYNIITNDYLSHHGILGQKWGVRRYQNEDGTLTSAGKERYSEKIRKKEAYRDRLISRADRKAKWSKEIAKEAKDDIERIKKEGTKSREVRERIRERSDDRFNDMTDNFGINPLAASIFDMGMTVADATLNANYLLDEILSEKESEYKYYRDRGEKFAKRANNLMDLDVSSLSRSDIRKIYRRGK